MPLPPDENFIRQVGALFAELPPAQHDRAEALLAAALDETRSDKARALGLVRAELGLAAAPVRNLSTLAHEAQEPKP